jgi:NADPH-dependent ferric siderophore reductase
MAAALPAGQRAIIFLEVPEPADEQDLASPAQVSISWLPRAAGAPAGDPAALAAALQAVELPPGTGHCYLFGEAKVVLRLREVLAGRGLADGQVSAKAYWGRGRANAQHGEPARDR